MTLEEPRILRLLKGPLEVALALVLAVIALALDVSVGDVWSAAIDVAACLAAATIPWWPRAGGTLLGGCLALIAFTPDEWSSMGEYAALIPILGTGLRGEHRARLWMTIAYGALLALMMFRDLPGDPLVVVAIGVWATLIALLWVIGNLFTAYQRAQAQARLVALQSQRLAVARDLHDTVARELGRASLYAQTALSSHDLPEIRAVVASVQEASAQLRWMLSLLRDPQSYAAMQNTDDTLLDAVETGAETLRSSGYDVTVSIDGELEHVPSAVLTTLHAVVGEACANIQRHGDPTQPCGIMISVTRRAIDALFLNGVREYESAQGRRGIGLAGMQERLAFVGGELVAEQEGSQWITRISIPV